jgi:hypothetical protein
LDQEKNLNECPICHDKTEFIPIGFRSLKGKTEEIFGRYKCVKCDWHSDIQEPTTNLTKSSRPKKAVYMYHTYDKKHKTLTFFVYTNQMKVKYPNLIGERFDRHLLSLKNPEDCQKFKETILWLKNQPVMLST